MAVHRGLDAKLYYLTTGTRAAWPSTGDPDDISEIDRVKDVTLTTTDVEADTTTRASGGFKETEPVLTDASISFDIPWDPSNTAFAALLAAYQGRTALGIACLDQASTVTGARGLWADMKITQFDRGEPLEDIQMATVTMKPAHSAVAPEWVTVAE